MDPRGRKQYTYGENYVMRNVFSSAVFGMFNSRNIRWVENVAHLTEIKKTHKNFSRQT